MFPTANINVAIGRFENPPPGQDPAQIRAARDYFFSMMCFVEADRQNRVQIPEHLLEHAGIKADDKQIVLVCHDLWMAISSEQAAEEERARGREAFEAVGQNVLDPVFGSSSAKGEKEESC
jgi:DNA-binding transcriptional regulator/RsmH inhibitor MraZ